MQSPSVLCAKLPTIFIARLPGAATAQERLGDGSKSRLTGRFQAAQAND